MSPEPEPGVIGSLPRTRPHRRSAKRAGSPTGAPPGDSKSAAEPEVVKAAAKPKRTAASPKPPTPKAPPAPVSADPSHGVLETAVQAAAELAEIGLHASARALRGAVSRLPRP
jgi:hypothetical protein